MAESDKQFSDRQPAIAEELLHAVVPDQPASVAELSHAILARYSVRDGSVKIAGCSIDDVPLFEICHVDGSAFDLGVGTGQTESSPPATRQTVFVDSSGNVLDPDFAESLGLNDAADSAKLPEHVRPSMFARIRKGAMAKLAVAFAKNPVAVDRVIWCKQATGKVGIQSGDTRAQVAFHGWTRRLIHGLDVPPPFTCECTGKSSYEIVADDDHRLTVPEAIGSCSVSGRAVVESVLLTSAYSGQLALPEHVVKCAVSGDVLLESECVTCQFCEQTISPAKRIGNHCAGCAKIPLATDSLVEKYRDSLPRDFKRKSVRIGESFACVYLTCSSGRKRHLIVLDRETIALKKHKQKTGWFGKWIDQED